MTAERDPTRFILVDASHPGNVGAAARAMRVMGFDDLVLVRPRDADVLRHPSARAMASGAVGVLERARIVDRLEQAIEGVQHLCATAMTPRDFGPPTHAPRRHLPDIAARGLRTAFVFGGERHGLLNGDVYRCHACLCIPTLDDYGSLNLAQAIQVIAYEWREALGAFPVVDRTSMDRVADAAAVQRLLVHWEGVLVRIGFLDPARPRKLVPRLNQALNRAALTEQEIHILRGIARAIERSDGEAT